MRNRSYQARATRQGLALLYEPCGCTGFQSVGELLTEIERTVDARQKRSRKTRDERQLALNFEVITADPDRPLADLFSLRILNYRSQPIPQKSLFMSAPHLYAGICK
ncbi:MAG: hypothetical protein DMG88_02855 [Acidobacteria bacterium]|nr:MAG: hypothetical protein DMG88_02855 [Acidobacteriota bacterium]